MITADSKQPMGGDRIGRDGTIGTGERYLIWVDGAAAVMFRWRPCLADRVAVHFFFLFSFFVLVWYGANSLNVSETSNSIFKSRIKN